MIQGEVGRHQLAASSLERVRCDRWGFHGLCWILKNILVRVGHRRRRCTDFVDRIPQ
jgi:hypothetical protein